MAQNPLLDPSPIKFKVQGVEISDYVAVLRRRWKIIVGATCGIFLVAMLWILTTPRIYEAKTTLQIGEEGQQIFAFQPLDLFKQRADPVLSQIEILKSRTIAEDVVWRLGLQLGLAGVPARLGLKVVDFVDEGVLKPQDRKAKPETDAPKPERKYAKPGKYHVRFLDATGRFSVEDEDGNELTQGQIGSQFNAAGFSATIQNAQARPGDAFWFTVSDFQRTAGGLRGRTTVSTKRNTNIVEVSVRALSPKEAADTANAVVEAYIRLVMKRQSHQAFSAKDFIAEQLKTVEKDLQNAEEKLSKYKSEKGLFTLSDEAQHLLEKWTPQETEKAKLQAHREASESILKMLKSPEDPSKPILISTAGLDNPLLAGLAEKLTELGLERVRLSEGYAAGHSLMVGLNAQIQEAKKNVIREVEASLNGLREGEKAVTSVLKDYEAELKRLPESELGIVGLLRTSKVNEALYTILFQKHEEARIAEASTIGNAWQVDTALPDPSPVSPLVLMNLVLGLMVGLFMGLGLAFVLDNLDRSVRSVQDLERYAGLATFGLIPYITDIPDHPVKAIAAATAGSRLSPRSARLIHHLEPRSFASEAYRSLRTNIQFATPGVKAPRFLVTSAGPHEGKSLSVANLAIAVAQMERRVVIVDGDLRRPVQHRMFHLERGTGLSDVLAGKLSWREGVQRTEVEYLDLLPGGHLPPNPAELLASGRMKNLLDELSQSYDMIIVDAPPVIAFTDSMVLGTLVDGVFLVVRAGATTPGAVERAKVMLQGVGAKLLGAILNGVSLEQGFGLPSYYRYHYGYNYHGSDEEREQHHGWKRWVHLARSVGKRWIGAGVKSIAEKTFVSGSLNEREESKKLSSGNGGETGSRTAETGSEVAGKHRKNRHKDRNRAES